MATFIEENVKEFIEKIVQMGEDHVKVFWSTQKSFPTEVSRYDLFLTNGAKHSFSRWQPFIETIYQANKNVNLQKTWESFEQKHPHEAKRTVIVEYLDTQEMRDKRFSLDRVYEQRDDKHVKAAAFKSWAGEYMAQFPEIGYEHDEYLSVNKIVEAIEEAVNGSKDKTIQKQETA